MEIDGDDAAWLRGQPLPDGVELAEVDEVEFWGRTYEQLPGSSLYVPASANVVDRVVDRFLADVEDLPAPIGVDLFCGAGGFSLGVYEAGFDVVASVEWDAPAAQTYLRNLGRPDCALRFATPADRVRWEKSIAMERSRKKPSDPLPDEWIGTGYRAARNMSGGCRAFFFGDVCAITGAQIMAAAGVDAVDVVFGGPPCQGLSTSNAKACLEDPRNGLIWEFMRIVAEIRPKSFIIENVPPILTVAKGALFNAIAQLANDAGYDVVATKLNAVNFGVPQYRVRAIIVGTREDVPGYTFPMPTTWAIGRPTSGHEHAWGVGDDAEKMAKRVPAQARYDASSRTWSFVDETAQATRGKKSALPLDEQLDIEDVA